MRSSFVAAVIIILLVSACAKPESSSSSDSTKSPASAGSPANGESSVMSKPEPSKPETAKPEVATPNAAKPEAFSSDGLARDARFVKQDGWIEEKAEGAMRKAQFRLPKQGSDPEDAVLVITWFGDKGAGDLTANMVRWSSQIKEQNGPAPQPVTATYNGREVTTIEYAGNYEVESPPGSGNKTKIDGARLIGGIIQDPKGPLYIRFVGPAATVEHWRASFMAFLAAL